MIIKTKYEHQVSAYTFIPRINQSREKEPTWPTPVTVTWEMKPLWKRLTYRFTSTRAQLSTLERPISDHHQWTYVLSVQRNSFYQLMEETCFMKQSAGSVIWNVSFCPTAQADRWAFSSRCSSGLITFLTHVHSFTEQQKPVIKETCCCTDTCVLSPETISCDGSQHCVVVTDPRREMVTLCFFSVIRSAAWQPLKWFYTLTRAQTSWEPSPTV